MSQIGNPMIKNNFDIVIQISYKIATELGHQI